MDSVRIMPTRTASLLLIAFLSLFPAELFATAQAGDVLVVNGQDHRIYTFPLEQFLDTHENLRPHIQGFDSSNARGYVATWMIRDDRFFLTKIEIEYLDDPLDFPTFKTKSVIDHVFPSQSPPILAKWYSGYLIVPLGAIVEHINKGCASLFEKYQMLTIVDGAITTSQNMSAEQYKKFRQQQFNLFQETEEYASIYEEARNNQYPELYIPSVIFDVYSCQYPSTFFERR